MINFYKKVKNVTMVFDTETNGLPNRWDAPMTDVENWPRVCQLAWKLFDHDGKVIAARQCIILPDGWGISDDVAKVHGFTTQYAATYGIRIRDAIDAFIMDYNMCDTLVAHNMKFDYPVIGAEMIRVRARSNNPNNPPKVCTMLSSIDLCQIPGARGFKYPKLQELHQHLFSKEFYGAHDAMIDVDACAACYFQMKNLGIEFVTL